MELSFDAQEAIIGLYGYQSEHRINSIGFITLNLQCLEKEEEFTDNWGPRETRQTIPDELANV